MEISLLGLFTVGLVAAAACSILWFTFSLGIPPMLTSGKVLRGVVEIVESTSARNFADLGSGWGSLIIPLARAHPEMRFTGYEVSWLPWLFSMLLKRLLKIDNLHLKRGDFLHSDLSGHDTLLCYLYPGAMQRLAAKLERDRLHDYQVISHTFTLPGHEPVRKIHCSDLYRTPVYHYHIHCGTRAKASDHTSA